MWTQSAFCTTATIVLGMELLYRPNEAEATHKEYRQLMRNAALRLRQRREDVMAAKSASMIDRLLEAEATLSHSSQTDALREEHIAKIFRDHLLSAGWTTVYTPSQILDIPETQDFVDWYDSLFGLN